MTKLNASFFASMNYTGVVILMQSPRFRSQCQSILSYLIKWGSPTGVSLFIKGEKLLLRYSMVFSVFFRKNPA